MIPIPPFLRPEPAANSGQNWLLQGVDRTECLLVDVLVLDALSWIDRLDLREYTLQLNQCLLDLYAMELPPSASSLNLRPRGPRLISCTVKSSSLLVLDLPRTLTGELSY